MGGQSLNLESRTFVAIFATHPYPVASAAVSSVTSFMALAVLVRSKQYKEPLGKMIFWLFLGDFMFYLPKVIMGFPYSKSDTICSIAELPTKFGMSAAFLWSASFAHAFYSAIRNEDADAVHKGMKWYVFINTSFSLLQAVVAATTGFVEYDEESKGCVHFLTEGATDYLMIFLSQLPLFGVIFLSIMWHLLGLCLLRKRFPQGNRSDLYAILLYPTILLVCWLPVMGLSLCNSFGIVIQKDIFIYAETLGNLQGFLDTLAYGGTNYKIKKVFKKIAKRCCKRPVQEHRSESFEELIADIQNRRYLRSRQSTSANLSRMETRLL